LVAVNDSVLGWIGAATDTTDPKVIGQLPGSTRASLHVVKTDMGSMVLRRYDRAEVTDRIPDIGSRDGRGLQAASLALGDLIPKLIAIDPLGEETGVPTLLLSFSPGAPAVRGVDLDLLSEPLAKLHRRQAPPDLATLSFDLDLASVVVPEWTSNPDAWSRAIEHLDREPPQAPRVFVHGDYHPGNVQWCEGELSGVLDWACSGSGPAALDVAHCRTTLAFLTSVSGAEEFLSAYSARSPGYSHDKWWDLAEMIGLSESLESMLALNAFGAGIEKEQAQSRADAWLLHVLD